MNRRKQKYDLDEWDDRLRRALPQDVMVDLIETGHTYWVDYNTYGDVRIRIIKGFMKEGIEAVLSIDVLHKQSDEELAVSMRKIMADLIEESDKLE